MTKSSVHTMVRHAFVVLALTMLAGCAGSRGDLQGASSDGKQGPGKWEARGIEIVRIKPTKNGLMLDLRYRVTDPETARSAIKQTTTLSLVDQASGTVLPVPNMAKVGKLRNVPNSDDTTKVYWVFFNNPGALVKSGSKVTLNIGDVKIRDIDVE